MSETDDNQMINSAWLKSIGGDEESPLVIRFGPVLVFCCDRGRWSAYSNGSSHWHKLVEVDCKGEVMSLLHALKIELLGEIQ